MVYNKKVYKNYGKSYYRSKSSNSLVRRSRGNLKAARRQTDQSSTVLNINSVICCKQPPATQQNPGVEVRYAATGVINIYDLLRRSEFFGNYAPMYDQFRIDSVNIKLGLAGNVAQNSFFTIYTAWDRNGLDTNQFIEGANNHMGTNIGSNVTTYSSSLSKSYASGGNWSMSRSITASSAQEKNQFISTDSLKQWYSNYDVQNNEYTINDIPAENVSSTNPCYPVKNDVYPFKPCFLVGVVGLDHTTALGPCTFTVEVDCAVTFRGLRKSAIV